MMAVPLLLVGEFLLRFARYVLIRIQGAIDANVVQNLSAIEWHRVVPFSPFGNESDSSSYLQWVVRLPEIGVRATLD